jgi:group I intron endonuclease
MNKNIKIIPLVSYTNASEYKNTILSENKNKSGIYRWNNLITGKSYIGSSISLSKRFSIYYSLNSLKRNVNKGSSAIYNALLKYNHSNFSLDIIEYCEPNLLISREQYYIDLLKPKYNILLIAGSKLGSKHSEATKAKMSINNTGKNHPFFGKNHSLESRIKIGESLKSIVRINNKTKIVESKTKFKLSLRSKGVSVKVFDSSNNLVNEFSTITSVAKHFNISNRTVSRYLDKDLSYKGFIFKSLSKDK